MNEPANWTIAWRTPRMNHFIRATDWAGTWQEAYDKAAEFTTHHPEMQVFYVSTKAAEDSGYVVPEDRGNILTDTGHRVRIEDTGKLIVPISYTLGSREMIGAMIQALPENYEMSLNRSDMRAVIFALATGAGFVTLDENDDTLDRAVSLFSSIAETLGIEGI